MNMLAPVPKGIRRSALGLQLPAVSWRDTLSTFDAVADVRLGCRSVAFMDRRGLYKALTDRRYRATLSGRVVLPADRLSAIALGILSPRRNAAAFEPSRFLLSLLTFMGEGRKIGLVGTDQSRLEAARSQFAQHAPWHVFTMIQVSEKRAARSRSATDALLDEADCDILLVDAKGWEEESRLENFLAFRHDGLMFLAGAAFDRCLGEKTASASLQEPALTICSPNKFSLS